MKTFVLSKTLKLTFGVTDFKGSERVDVSMLFGNHTIPLTALINNE